MAKRKNSPALFEVINKPKEPARPAAAVPVPPPRVTARRAAKATSAARPAPAAAPVPKAAPPPVQAPSPAPAPRVAYPPISPYPAALARPTPAPAPAATPRATIGGPKAAETPTPEPAPDLWTRVKGITANLRSAAPSRPAGPRLSYTVAIVGIFAVVAGIILAVALARRAGRASALVIATATSEQLRDGPADPGVMDLSRPPASNTLMATTGSHSAAGTLASSDAQRSVGLNYVVVQSYAVSEQKMAADACEFLKRNNVPCTVERDVVGWTNRLVIVGTAGFTHVKSPDFAAYVARIQLLSTAYAPGKNNYHAFAPMAKKWDKEE